MTNRPTSHDKKPQAEKPEVPDFSRYRVCDSYSNPITDTPVTGGADTNSQRLSHKRLLELRQPLGIPRASLHPYPAHRRGAGRLRLPGLVSFPCRGEAAAPA